MASQNFNLEVRYSNGIPKLYVDVTDKFNVTVNKFSYNNVVYIHICRKGKTLSLPFEDLEELVGLIPTIKGKLSLLETPRQQTHQAPQDIDLNRQTQQQQLQLSQQPQQLQTQQQQLQLSQQPQQVQPQQHLQLSQQPQQVQPQQHLQLSQQPPQFITFTFKMFLQVNEHYIEIPMSLFEASNTLKMLQRHDEQNVSLDILSKSHEDFIQIIDNIKNKEKISQNHLALFIELMDYLAVEKAFADLYIPWLEILKVF